MTSVLSEAPFFVRLGVNILIRKLDSQPIIKMSVYDYLWESSDPILKLAAKMVPSMIPTDNVGVLNMVSPAWRVDLNADLQLRYLSFAGRK
jgi:hypothetical protein